MSKNNQDNKTQSGLVLPKEWTAAFGPAGLDTATDSGFPSEWTVFGPVGKYDPEPDFAGMTAIPEELTVAGKRLTAQPAAFTRNRLDLGALLGGQEEGKNAYLLATVEAAKAMEIGLGAGADWWMKWWVNGEVLCDTMATGNKAHPPSVLDHRFTARLKAGRNLIAVKVVSGSGGFVLAAGGLCPGAMAAHAEAQAELDSGILSASDPALARQWVARHCAGPRRVLFDPGHRLDLATCATVSETIAWLHTEITADKAVEAVMGAGAGGELLVLVNGEKVLHLPPQPNRPDISILDHSFAVRLQAGANRIDVMIRPNRMNQQFDLALGGPAELRAEEERQQAWQQTVAALTDKRDAAPSGEIVYVNPNPPEVPLKPYSGERYRDRVPDTYDVAERAALCINALTGATNPLANHELYFWAYFLRNPVAMRNNIDDWCQIKFMEALPLLRLASGSRLRLEVDEVWHRVTLKSIGPDGLFYLPLSGRPWIRGGGCFPNGFPVACADGKMRRTLDPAVTQFSHPFVNSRQFNALIVYHLRDGNPFWVEMMRKRLARMAELIAYRDDFCFWLDIGYEPGTPWKPEAAGELPSGMNAIYFTAMLCYWAGKYHRLTGDKQAAALGGKAARFVMRHGRYFGPAGEFQGDKHFHAHAQTLVLMLEYATATGDRETLEFVRKSYEWAKTPAAGSCDTIGFFPETAHPGYGTCEACEIADMIGLALKLSRAGVGDYYNDAERWIRNHFAESQLLEEQVSLIYYLSGKQPQTPVAENETAWRVAERNVGAFAGWSSANDWATRSNFSIMHCCTGNAARTLYWIWLEALRFNDGELRVNLLLNRASREADVYSFIPYQGKVEIKFKAACKAVYVHAPGWVKTGSPEMKAAVDGKAVKTRWEGRYLVLGPAQAGQCVTVEFPIAERTVKETIGSAEYTLVIKGDTVVSIDPPGKNLPLYRRDHYRQSEPRYVEVERFLSDTVVEY